MAQESQSPSKRKNVAIPELLEKRMRCESIILMSVMAASAAAACGEEDSAASTGGQTVTATIGSSSSSGGGSEGATATPTTTSEGSGTQGDTTVTPTTDPGTSTSTSTTGEPGSTSAGTTTGNTTEPIDPCEADKGGIDFSYLWIANTTEGSISKINTKTMIEEGRYYADPTPDVASPSRTSVNIDGHYVVVSNRGTGTITKVAANIEDCVDKNGDGKITTSQNKDNLLPWGTDECMIWNVKVNPPPDNWFHGPRATAWAPGVFNKETCKFEDQSVWVGWTSTHGHGKMARFNGETGVQEATVLLEDWALTTSYAPYGAAADGFGNIWFTSIYNELGRINTETLELKRWPSNGIQFYGMTVDSKGDVWFGPYSNQPVAKFDTDLEQFVQVPGTTEYHRGVAVDADGMVWVASNAGGTNGCGLNQIDSNTMTQVQFHKFEKCGTPVGVSIDADGFIWMVDQEGWAYRMDPNTFEKIQVVVPGDHYTYSDMTGAGLLGAVIPQ